MDTGEAEKIILGGPPLWFIWAPLNERQTCILMNNIEDKGDYYAIKTEK